MVVLKENMCVRVCVYRRLCVFQVKEGTVWLCTCVKTTVGRL